MNGCSLQRWRDVEQRAQHKGWGVKNNKKARKPERNLIPIMLWVSGSVPKGCGARSRIPVRDMDITKCGLL